MGDVEKQKSVIEKFAKSRPLSRSGRDSLERVMRTSNQASTATQTLSWAATLLLAYQTTGVVYGDIGTSPLYVYATAFSDGLDYPGYKKDLIGATSIIIWSLTLSPLVKYLLVVLYCNDNGEGGTFALYSVMCRHLRISKLPTKQRDDQNLSKYSIENSRRSTKVGDALKSVLENSKWTHSVILIIVLTATSMVIGDGVLTPAQSVLSAIGGIQVSDPSLSQDVVIGVTCAVLVLLFVGQKYGTSKVGFTFAPICVVWFVAIFILGIYNLFHYNGWGILRSFSPHYGIQFLIENEKQGWVQLGGLFLTITGTEAMFADLGHFSPAAIQIAFSFFVYPCLLVQYLGQAAYLTEHPEHVSQTFYKSIPSPVYWPVFVVATAAAAIASQAMITASYSIVNQSMALGCFPRVKVQHTSDKIKGQIYIPELNWLLMIICIIVVVGLRNTTNIGHAYGIAVCSVMVITTILVTIIHVTIKRSSILFWLPFFLFFFAFEGVYLSSNLYKFPSYGWVPVAITGVFLSIMYIWHYGTLKKYEFNLENKLSLGWVLSMANAKQVTRVPGVGIFYSELITGIPAIFSHFIASMPAIHEVVVFLAVKHVEVPYVDQAERFFIRRLGPRKSRMFRCVVRYGYADIGRKEQSSMVDGLFDALRMYIQTEDFGQEVVFASNETSPDVQPMVDVDIKALKPDTSVSLTSVKTTSDVAATSQQATTSQPRITAQGSVIECEGQEDYKLLQQHELEFLQIAREMGVVHLVGRSHMRARSGSSLVKRIMVNYGYVFLRQNSRESTSVLNIPSDSLLEVGMIIDI